MNNIDPNTTKYMVKAKINADGIVEKPDVVGAIFGQTEGLLGDDLDLRDLQKSGRIGRIEVEVTSQVETVILASALETVDRVGPCKASIHVLGIEDVRITKREKVVERAKELLNELIKQSKGFSYDITDSVRQSVQVEEITTYGKDRCPAGPNVRDSEAIIIVEGRSDVLNLLKAGIKNAIAVEGTNIPKTVQELSRERVATAFVDGDRGGELILRELFQVAEVDFVARAPRAHEVEELTAKQIIKCLRNKVPGDQYMEMNGLVTEQRSLEEIEEDEDREERHERRDRRRDRDEDREERHERRDRRRDRDEDREERRERESKKDRFNTDAIDKYRKKRDEDREEKSEAIPMPPAERSLAVKSETHLMVREEKSEVPAETPAEVPAEPAKEPEPVQEPVEVPAEPEPAKEEKPKEEKPKAKTRASRKRTSDKVLTPEQEMYRDMLLDLSTTHNAKVLDKDNQVIRQVAVKSLVNSLKEDSENVASIVFDGVISQRILDVSADKGISIVVGTRKGNITKMPADITIWTKEDLY